jgi:hypothetical protein
MPLGEGDRCLAGPDRQWGDATIRKVFADGTCKVEFDEKQMVLMPYWYGVPPEEISIDDESLWSAVFARLVSGEQLLTSHSFASAWRALGGGGTQEQLDEYWSQQALEVGGSAAGLDEAQAYRLFRRMQMSAKLLNRALEDEPQPHYTTFYWNLTRMGGRDPAAIARAVTVEDALAAFGVSQQPIDKQRSKEIANFEARHALRLPQELKTILERQRIEERFKDVHPNNPTLMRIAAWEVTALSDPKVQGTHAVTIIEPHQGDMQWAAVFAQDSSAAKIYVHWVTDDGQPVWLLQAPSAAMFFWDLAQTGLSWWDDTKHDGGRPVLATDIGLKLDEGSLRSTKWFLPWK